MSEIYPWIKWAHILSATLLFGTGIGTAFHLYATHRRADLSAIVVATRNTVLADWLFTATSGIVRVITGAWLVFITGFDPFESWLVATYGLYVLAGACWVKVVHLQYRIRDLAGAARAAGGDLPDEYHQAMKLWFILGWPAFLALIAIFSLMVFKPVLW